jgi:hypothetical protein
MVYDPTVRMSSFLYKAIIWKICNKLETIQKGEVIIPTHIASILVLFALCLYHSSLMKEDFEVAVKILKAYV